MRGPRGWVCDVCAGPEGPEEPLLRCACGASVHAECYGCAGAGEEGDAEPGPEPGPRAWRCALCAFRDSCASRAPRASGAAEGAGGRGGEEALAPPPPAPARCALCGREEPGLAMKSLDRRPSEAEARALAGARRVEAGQAGAAGAPAAPGSAESTAAGAAEAEPPRKRAPSPPPSQASAPAPGVSPPSPPPSPLASPASPAPPPFCHCFCFRCLPGADYDESSPAISLDDALACVRGLPRGARPCAYCGGREGRRIRCAAPAGCETWYHPSCCLRAGGGVFLRDMGAYTVLYPVCREHAGVDLDAEDPEERERRRARQEAALGRYERLLRRARPFWVEGVGTGTGAAALAKTAPSAPGAAPFTPAGASRPHSYLGVLGRGYACAEHDEGGAPLRAVTCFRDELLTNPLSIMADLCLGAARAQRSTQLLDALGFRGCDCVYDRARAVPDELFYVAEAGCPPGAPGSLRLALAGAQGCARIEYSIPRVFATVYGVLGRRFRGGAGGQAVAPGAPSASDLASPSGALCPLSLAEAFDAPLPAQLLPRLSFARLRVCPGLVLLAELAAPASDLRRLLPVLSAPPHPSLCEAVGFLVRLREPQSLRTLRCCLVLKAEASRPLWGPREVPGASQPETRPEAGEGLAAPRSPDCALLLYMCKFPQALPRALLSVP